MVEFKQLGFSNIITRIRSNLGQYYDIVLGIVFIIILVVARFILFFVVFCKRFIYRKSTGCEWLEILWTISPAFILCYLSFISLTNLYRIEIGETIDFQIKIVGHQ